MTTTPARVDPRTVVHGALDALSAELGDAVRVRHGHPGWTEHLEVTPTRAPGCPVSVRVDDDGVVLELSSLGGRWELGPTPEDLATAVRLVRGAVLCGVVEVAAAARALVTVHLEDGATATAEGCAGLAGCVPLPGWRSWGRTTRYPSYLGVPLT